MKDGNSNDNTLPNLSKDASKDTLQSDAYNPHWGTSGRVPEFIDHNSACKEKLK